MQAGRTGDGNADTPERVGGRDCRRCRFNGLCLCDVLDKASRQRGSRLCRKSLHAGAELRLTDEPVNTVFVIVSGLIWHVARSHCGMETVRGLYFPGTVVQSMPSACLDWHDRLETPDGASICRLRTDWLGYEQRKGFAHLHSERMRSELEFQLGLLSASPASRLARFLMRVSAQLGTVSFSMPMPRNRVACYLGLSRDELDGAITHLAGRGWIARYRNEIDILDTKALLTVA